MEIEKLFFEYINGPSITWCSDSDDFYEFNREERRRSVNGFRFTYSTERDKLGGYFLFEIRGKLFLYLSSFSMFKFTCRFLIQISFKLRIVCEILILLLFVKKKSKCY